ncbi:MAG: site-2 protease family protein [Patescibacteria group bacterium]
MEIQGTLLISALVGLGVIVLVLMSLTVHEFAHAFVANLFGDPTAKMDGRMSLNPLRHWDPVGTTLLVGLLVLRIFGVNLPVFGWGKPVPVDERNFDNPRLYGIQTALAGPMSNLLLAIAFAALYRFVPLPGEFAVIIFLGVYLNLFLMFFNLLPIPPLDGSRLLRLFLPEQTYFALASNPLLFFGIFFLVIFFLLDYLVLASNQMTALLIGS